MSLAVFFLGKPALPWRKKQVSESGSRCEQCATRHVIFLESSDHGVIVPAAELETFRCAKCGAAMFELDVKDGSSVVVLVEDDPLVAKMRRKMASHPKTTFKKVDWEHPFRRLWVIYWVVVFFAAVTLIWWLRSR